MKISNSTSRLLSAILAAVLAGLASALTIYFIFGQEAVSLMSGVIVSIMAFLLINQNAMVGLTCFLCQCGGANMAILEKCPSEASKVASVGLTVLLTGVFAAMSGGYAMYKIFNNLAASIVLGVIWGIMIFNIDRYIVMSMRKTGQIANDLKIATPRIVLAIFISIVVVKPLEIRLFADRLQEKIKDLEMSSKEDFKKRRESLYGKDVVIKKMQEYGTQADSLNRMVTGEPVNDPQYETLKNETQSRLQRRQQITRENAPLINHLKLEINMLEKNPSVYQLDSNGIKKPAGADAIHLASNIAKLRELKTDLKNSIDAHELANKNQLRYLENYQQRARDLVNDIMNQSAEIKKKSDSIDIAMRPDILKGDTAVHAAFTDNFVTQIEALGDLTSERLSTMWWMSWMIIILFMIIETSPIFVKLISPSGPYDEMLEAENVRLKSKSIYDSNTQMMMDEHDNQVKLQTYIQLQQNKSQEIENAIKAWALRKKSSLKQDHGSWSDEDFKRYINELTVFSDELLASMNGSKKQS